MNPHLAAFRDVLHISKLANLRLAAALEVVDVKLSGEAAVIFLLESMGNSRAVQLAMARNPVEAVLTAQPPLPEPTLPRPE